MSARFTTSDGLSLAYDDRGTGHPLLCLAGLTRNMADFEPVVDAFGARARVVRLDARGRGQSDRDADWRNYNLVREAQDALELMDHLGLEAVSILGTSRGGLIAMTLMATAADRLVGAILVDIGPEIEERGLDAIKAYIGRPPPYATLDEAADKLAEAMAPAFSGVSRDAWRAHAGRIWREGPEGLELTYDSKLRDAVVAAFEGETPDLWPLFDALGEKPLALIRGANSDLLSAETAAEMRRRQPDMLFSDVPDRGHVPFLDEPAARGVIAAYLDRVADARTEKSA